MNLPAADKMVDPYFTMLWDADIPRVDQVDDQGRTATATVIAGGMEWGSAGEDRVLPFEASAWAASVCRSTPRALQRAAIPSSG